MAYSEGTHVRRYRGQAGGRPGAGRGLGGGRPGQAEAGPRQSRAEPGRAEVRPGAGRGLTEGKVYFLFVSALQLVVER